MQIKYDYPDMPIGTLLDFGGMAVSNGVAFEVTEEQERIFRQLTGLTFAQAAKTTPQLTIPRKKVN